jgi:hypothetical protein
VRHNRPPYPVIRVKQPAQTITSLPGCMREVTDCGLSF